MSIVHHFLSLLFCFCVYQGYAQDAKNKIIISGEFANNVSSKKITLQYWENIVSYATMKFTAHQTEVIQDNDGEFRFVIYPERPAVYLKIGWEYDNKGMVDENYPFLYLAENGDSVRLKIDSASTGYHLSFEGEGAVKFKAMYEQSQNHLKLRRDWSTRNKSNYNSNDYRSWRIKRDRDAAEYLTEEQLALLARYKTGLGASAYNIYKTDIFSKRYLDYCRVLYKVLHWLPVGVPFDSAKVHVKGALARLEKKLDHFEAAVGNEALSKSAYYTDLQLCIAKIKAKLEGVSRFEIISQLKSPVVRDRTLANYLIFYGSALDSATKDSLFQKITTLVEDPFCLKEVVNYMEGSKVGAKAYNFSLPDTSGKQVRLSDFKGKVVFIDFWYAGCGGCAEYYRKVVKYVEERYKEIPDVVFIAVSIDRDRERWLKFLRKEVYTSEDVVNLHCPDGMENPIIQQFAVKRFPHPLLIDRNGKVFSDSDKELRFNGIDGLVNMIEKARKMD